MAQSDVVIKLNTDVHVRAIYTLALKKFVSEAARDQFICLDIDVDNNTSTRRDWLERIGVNEDSDAIDGLDTDAVVST